MAGLTQNATAYNFDRRILQLGAIEIDGIEGNIRIEQGPIYADKTGQDGKTCRYRMLDRTVTITIPLQFSSATNDQLSALQKLALSGAVRGLSDALPFVYRDESGRTFVTLERCWIQNVPTIDVGQEAGTREWVLRGVGLVRFDGGSQQ